MPLRWIERRLVRTLRGRNVVVNAFELWIGVAGILTATAYVVSHHDEPYSLAQTIGPVAASVWQIGYGLTGCALVFGILRPSPRWEIAGLFMLGGATATNGLAVLSVFGSHGLGTGVTLVMLAVAAWLRADFLLTSAVDAIRANGDAAAAKERRRLRRAGVS